MPSIVIDVSYTEPKEAWVNIQGLVIPITQEQMRDLFSRLGAANKVEDPEPYFERYIYN